MALVSLIIPIYNEESHLHKFLGYIDKVDVVCDKELIFIDDCSSDKSFEILEKFTFESSATILKQPVNQGKGAALRKGFASAKGDIIGVQDADFEYRAEDIKRLIAPIIAGESDIVFGTRFSKGNHQVHRTYHYLINRFLTLISNMLSGLYLSDMETCYKFFKAEIIQNVALESNRFGFEPEVTAKIARLRTRVLELPISYFPRNYLEGKKITWKDGVAALFHLVRFNFMCRNGAPLSGSLPEKYMPRESHWL